MNKIIQGFRHAKKTKIRLRHGSVLNIETIVGTLLPL